MKRFTLTILSIGLRVAAVILLSGLLCPAVPVTASLGTNQTDIAGPSGSDEFGASVLALPSGNIVVTDPSYDSGATANVGAVYLYNGATGALISTLTGSTAYNQVGSGGLVLLENGNYVVLSPSWYSDGTYSAGAATWGDGTTGVSGVVSSANSLVGTTANDEVGSAGVTALTNGNYVVLSPDWDSGTVEDAGAATWGNGTTGTTGVVTTTNSLVGSTASDEIAWEVMPLTNGNYVVLSPNWDNGAVADAGAATWGNGTTGTTGVVSSANSLVGSSADDNVGNEATVLTNGNYVVLSHHWDNGAGAATWRNGTTGVSGVVSASNSLVGSTADDRVGDWAEALTNGNYVVLSPHWDNGAGAATWGNGTTGTTGTVGASNSLVGSTADDEVGIGGVTALTNGNYVVRSEVWNGAVADAGASTWGDGTTGVSGVVSSANSLVGSTAQDYVGGDQTALTNGHYVAVTRRWDSSTVVDAGAVTWGNGKIGATGTIRAENSVRGTPAGGGMTMGYDYDYTNDQLVVGRPAENIVTLFKPPSLEAFLPLVLKKV